MDSELINKRFDEHRRRQGLTSVETEGPPLNIHTKETVTNMSDRPDHNYPPVVNIDVDAKTPPNSDQYVGGASPLTCCKNDPDDADLLAGQEGKNTGYLQRSAAEDKSRKGSVDLRILPLVNLINSTDNFFTTSTCSGRIILFANESLVKNENKEEADLSSTTVVAAHSKVKKKGCDWLLVSHDEISPENLIQTVKKATADSKVDVTFKVEPAILHIQCRKLSEAKRLVHAATEAGFRNSGMVIGKDNRITVAIRQAMSMEVPFDLKNPSLDREFLENFLTKRANEKILETWTRTNKFMLHFENAFLNIETPK